MDNTSYYVSIAKMLLELANANLATASKFVLSNKTATTFDYAKNDASASDPAPGDFLVQGEFHALILSANATQLTIADTTDSPNNHN